MYLTGRHAGEKVFTTIVKVTLLPATGIPISINFIVFL
jgi:hypothetical protein